MTKTCEEYNRLKKIADDVGIKMDKKYPDPCCVLDECCKGENCDCCDGHSCPCQAEPAIWELEDLKRLEDAIYFKESHEDYCRKCLDEDFKENQKWESI